VAVEHTLAHLGRWQGDRARYVGRRKNLFDLRRTASCTTSTPWPASSPTSRSSPNYWTGALVTGSARGLGLALVKGFLARGDHVFAGCREIGRACELVDLTRRFPSAVQIVSLDVTSPDSRLASVRVVRSQTEHLDVLVNNAGLSGRSDEVRALRRSECTVGPKDFCAAVARALFEVNALAPVERFLAYRSMMLRGARVINISSERGSIARKNIGGNYEYCASKAALNMFTRGLAHDAARDGIVVAAIHPGWMRTDMGGPNAEIGPDEAARGLNELIDRLSLDDAGAFVGRLGERLPW
jgi:NAD(P)-dependent dehydrogenase (short-subunit alcohol dehydrogenase family)